MKTSTSRSESAEERASRIIMSFCLHYKGAGNHYKGECSSCLTEEFRAAESAARTEERKRCAAICRMLAKAHEDNGNSVIAVWSASGCALAIERPTFQEQADE